MQNLSLKFELPLIPTGNAPVLLPNINNKSMKLLKNYRPKCSLGIIMETEKIQDMCFCLKSYLCGLSTPARTQREIFCPQEIVQVNVKQFPETLKMRQFQLAVQQRVITQPYTSRRRIPLNKLSKLKDVHNDPQPCQINIERNRTIYKIKMIGQQKQLNQLEIKAKEYYSRLPRDPFELDTRVKAKQPSAAKIHNKFQLELTKPNKMQVETVEMTPRQQIELENKWQMQRTAIRPY